jgi:acyl-coenzyme A synthetase/AMP-(fatty) acid ligase
MPQKDNPRSLSDSLRRGDLRAGVTVGADASASWAELAAGYGVDHSAVELRGRSVLLGTVDPIAAATALIQLDGIARRIVLYPPDMPREHLVYAARTAAADVIVTDEPVPQSTDLQVACIGGKGRKIAPSDLDRSSQIETEWILLTSGTTGLPKLAVHTLASLTGAIGERAPSDSIVWSTFYDIRRYGGLQIFLRAALGGTPLVLPGPQESSNDFLSRAAALGITHISGTPSHWRRALMSPSIDRISPSYVRLSGEIAGQALLNRLQSQFPQARIAHAFASVEAGVVFEVIDGLMGFPSEIIEGTPQVEMKVENGTLRVRSSRTASHYLGPDSPPLRDAEGFVDNGDALQLRDGRYYFLGRRDGTINVGGLKVHPEEVEAVINRHPEVSISLVRPKKSPITGSLVVADVVLKAPQQADAIGSQELQRNILQFCQSELALHKVPVTINFVPALAVAESGKLIRRHA